MALQKKGLSRHCVFVRWIKVSKTKLIVAKDLPAIRVAQCVGWAELAKRESSTLRMLRRSRRATGIV